MPNLRLTDVSVRALKASERYETYWDTQTPGFGIRVGKRSKTWTVMRGKDRARITVGRYPDLSLADARAEAKKLLAEAAPPTHTKEISRTYVEAREEFLETHFVGMAARTRYNSARSLKQQFSAFERLRLDEIGDRDIKRCLDQLADRPSEQLHAFRYLRTFFNWCARAPRRYVKVSPLYGYEPPGVDRRGTRILSDAELVAVWNAADTPGAAIFRAMILWGTRNTETCVLERVWRVNGVLTIPGAHTKNGRDHAIPVLPLAEHVLSQAHGNGQHFFAGRGGDGHLSHNSLAKLKADVMARSETTGWQLRDIRRTFRSNMARLGVPRDLCEVLINHAPPVLDDIYDRYDRLAEKRAALASYEEALLWLLARA